MPDDFYDLLGLPRDATQDDVKRAFREKVRVYHPDLNDDPRAQAQFTALKKAYDTLGDPKERQDYDRMGHEEYVAKRIKGLPSQDEWATGSSESTTEATASGGSTATATASRTSGSTVSGTETDPSATAGTRSTSTATTGRGTSARASAGAATTRTGGSTAESTGATARRRSHRRTGTDTSLRSRVMRVWRIGVGWPLIFATDVLYVIALELFVGANQSAVVAALSAVADAGTDVEALQRVLLEPSDLGLFEFVTASNYVDGVPVAGGVFVLGTLILPAVYGIVIGRTRRSYSAWDPTRLYVVATLAPLAGLAIAAAGFARLGTDLLLLGVLPLGAIVLLPLSAFVRPWILDKLGRR